MKQVPIVELQKVGVTYGQGPDQTEALVPTDLTIAKGDFVALVGPSGCGKSTTLRMVAGLEEVTAGEIRIGERVVNDVPPKDRDIAMVFQNYALYPHMTVYKNMAFGLKLRRVPRSEIDRKVRQAAKLLNIEELLGRKPKALSGGQRQRVAVGRAIVRTPQAFLFDEPLSNLDAKLRVETRAELKKLHRRLATTTIYVTHDQEEAMTLGDRVVVMKDGVIQQCATPLEVYGAPVNRFVGGFVGTPPMNFLSGLIVLADDGHLYFDEGSARLRLPARLKGVLARWVTQPMVLGLRPESFSCRSEGKFAGPDNCLNVSVSVVETLGDKMDLYVQTSTHDPLVCRVESDGSLTDGIEIPVYVNMDQVHVFEPGDEGVNVSLNGTGDCVSAA